MFTYDRYLYAGLLFVLTVKFTKKVISLINYLRMIAFSDSKVNFVNLVNFLLAAKKKKKSASRTD